MEKEGVQYSAPAEVADILLANALAVTDETSQSPSLDEIAAAESAALEALSHIEQRDRQSESMVSIGPEELLIICEMVGVLVAGVVSSEMEWKEWGEPFLQMAIEAQFDESNSHLGTNFLVNFNSKFLSSAEHRDWNALWVEDEPLDDSENQLQDGYALVSDANERLIGLMEPLLDKSDEVVEAAARRFMMNFFRHVVRRHGYDARGRAVARKMCQLLNLSATRFVDLEKSQAGAAAAADAAETLINQPPLRRRKKIANSGDSGSDTEYENGGAILVAATESASVAVAKECRYSPFAEKFNRAASTIPRASLVVSHRFWKIALVAAGGGAMVGVAGYAAVPSILATVWPLASSAASFARLVFALDTATSAAATATAMATTVTTVGGYALPVVVPPLCGGYGASIAGRKMWNRTAELSSFELQPLHIGDAAVLAAMGETVPGTVAATAAATAAASAAAYASISAGENRVVASTAAAMAAASTAASHRTVPVYLLVSGHIDKSVDERAVWGASGSVLLVDNVHSRKDIERRECLSRPTSERPLLAITESGETECEVGELVNKPLEGEDNISIDVPKEDLDEWQELEMHYRGWWRELVPHGEEYILHWEPAVLASLNESLVGLVTTHVMRRIHCSLNETLWQLTPAAPLRAAFGLPKAAIRQLASLDDAWVVAMDRAAQAGKLLAETLIAARDQDKGVQSVHTGEVRIGGSSAGEFRPVTLIGFGMGARLIYHCLEALASMPDGTGNGCVENVVLMGAPVGADRFAWERIRGVVAHRLVNVFSRLDWILALLYRQRSLEVEIAGLSPIRLHASHAAEAAAAAAAASKLGGRAAVTAVKIAEKLAAIATAAASLEIRLTASGEREKPRRFEAEDITSGVKEKHSIWSSLTSTVSNVATRVSLTVKNEVVSLLSLKKVERDVDIELTITAAPETDESYSNPSDDTPTSATLRERLAIAAETARCVENVDVSAIVFNHYDYPQHLPVIIRALRL